MLPPAALAVLESAIQYAWTGPLTREADALSHAPAELWLKFRELDWDKLAARLTPAQLAAYVWQSIENWTMRELSRSEPRIRAPREDGRRNPPGRPPNPRHIPFCVVQDGDLADLEPDDLFGEALAVPNCEPSELLERLDDAEARRASMLCLAEHGMDDVCELAPGAIAVLDEHIARLREMLGRTA